MEEERGKWEEVTNRWVEIGDQRPISNDYFSYQLNQQNEFTLYFITGSWLLR